MKLILKIALFLPIMAMVVAINYLVDPGHLYHGNELLIARMLIEGKDVSDEYEAREGMVVVSYLETCEGEFDIIVLGSSRAMPIGSDSFPNNSLHNFSVSSASLQNIHAIYDIMKEYDVRCKIIILALDPWLVLGSHEGPHQDLDLIYYQKRDAMRFYASLLKQHYDRITELVSFGYFQSSMHSVVFQQEREGVSFHAANNKDHNVLRSDGSRKWKKKYNEMSVLETRAAANKYINNGLKVYSFTQINEAMKMEFEDLIRRIRKSGVEMVFWFPPYHPAVYKKIRSDYPNIIEAQEYFSMMARKNTIRVYGSFDPEVGRFAEHDFFDFHHLKNRPLDNHMKRMAEELGL